MVCPFCLHKKSEVFNTRSTKNNTTIWRRRRCMACRKIFTTHEVIVLDGILRVKNKSKKTVPYSKTKLLTSLLKSLDHRPNVDTAIWYIANLAEQQLLPIASKQQGVIEVGQIFDICSQILKRYDGAAYIKYISYNMPSLDAHTLRAHLRK